METQTDTGGMLKWMHKKWISSYRLNAWRTACYAWAYPARATRAIFILGCQRSGTTMLANLIGLSPQVKVYGEGDEKYFYWDGAPRLQPLDKVRDRLATERNPVTVLKPLCESQRAKVLLAQVAGSQAIWIFRDYLDCVASHMKYYSQFHDGREYVQELLATDIPCWKTENLPADVIALLEQKSEQSLNEETCYALYWLARNSLVLQQTDPRIKLFCYEQLIRQPVAQCAELFEFLQVPYNEQYSRIINERNNRCRSLLLIDEDVTCMCNSMYQRLVSFSTNVT